MKRIMPIYGTRPEAIKMAPIVKALQRSEHFECEVTVTGQHREMLDQVNELFGIVSDHDLNIIQPRQTLNGVLTRTVNGLDELFSAQKPDAVIVQGDTTTTTAGALAAFYTGIPVIHAEAGLRSFNLFSPFPEEANRKMTSQITSLHLAPTSQSKDNLLRESLPEEDIVVTGNTVIDALLEVAQKEVPFSDPQLEEAARSGQDVLLVTTHRRENQGAAMEGVGRALARLADRYPEKLIVLPAHRNPVVREAILPALAGHSNVIVTEPLPYGEFTRLMNWPLWCSPTPGRPGGGPLAGQAGAGHAGEHRAPRSRRRRHRAADRHRRGARGPGGLSPVRLCGVLSGHGQCGESLWRRPGRSPDRGRRRAALRSGPPHGRLRPPGVTVGG